MPGYVVHLALAEEIRKARPHITDRDFYMFQIGSIAPDTEKTGYKRKSHFWTEDMVKRFTRRPNLEIFLGEYGDRIGEPYVLGYYAHLLLDYKFVDEYWRKHYEFFDADGNICDDYDGVRRVRMDGSVFIDRYDFFSGKYYYGDYDRMNGYLLSEYKIRIPKYRQGMLAEGGIAEVCGEDAEAALKKMLDFLEDSRGRNDEPELLAFDLHELKGLISDTANIITERIT